MQIGFLRDAFIPRQLAVLGVYDSLRPKFLLDDAFLQQLAAQLVDAHFQFAQLRVFELVESKLRASSAPLGELGILAVAPQKA